MTSFCLPKHLYIYKRNIRSSVARLTVARFSARLTDMQLFLELELELEGTRNSFFCLADKKSLSSRVSLFFLVEETVLTILQKTLG